MKLMDRAMVKIKTIEKTSDACPSYWCGETTDGRYWRIRYRWGYLSVKVDHDQNKLSVFSPEPSEFDWGKQIGDGTDGVMNTLTMLMHVYQMLDFLDVKEKTEALISSGI